MLRADGPAPYAPLKPVMNVIQRHRNFGLGTIDIQVLTRLSVSESLAPRTLQALRLLELIDEEGRPTEAFEELRKAPSAEFEERLAALLRDVYAPVFQVVDPTTADASEIEDAFRHFAPRGQRGRMITLFTGLLSEAGMVRDAPRKKPGTRAAPERSPSTRARSVDTAPEPTAVSTLRSAATAGAGDGDVYEVQLASGGTVRVAVAVNLFRLSGADREFVIELVDRLVGYAGALTSPEAEGANS